MLLNKYNAIFANENDENSKNCTLKIVFYTTKKSQQWNTTQHFLDVQHLTLSAKSLRKPVGLVAKAPMGYDNCDH